MLDPVDRCPRDSTWFQITTKRLRDFIDPNHLLIRIDEQLDFAKLVAPSEERYGSDYGRPAIHPEVMVRALLIGSLYNIASFCSLCSVISENIAYRWFCFPTIDDQVFDHSTISYFIETEFETEKSDVGLDEYETRTPYQVRGRLWTGWHHHVALCLLGGTFLLSLQQAWGKKMHLITRLQVYRVVREMLPRERFGPDELLRWLKETQECNERARRSHAKRRAALHASTDIPP